MRRQLIAFLCVSVATTAMSVGAAARRSRGEREQGRGGAAASRAGDAGDNLILGQVVDGSDGSTVGGAVVSLNGNSRRVLADAQGRFVFFDLAAGSYSIRASKPGYLAGAPGQRRPEGSGQPLVLTEGRSAGDVKVPVWRHASVSGRLTDESGEPVVGVTVTALRRTIAAGHARWSRAFNTSATDERGVFRIGDLVPGDYVVAVATTERTIPVAFIQAFQDAWSTSGDRAYTALPAVMRPITNLSGIGVRIGDFALRSSFSLNQLALPPIVDGARVLVYPTSFYPATTDLTRAQMLTLAAGEDREGIEMQLRPVRAGRISGIATGLDGPMANLELRLVPAYANDLESEQLLDIGTTATDATGAFTFVGIPAGQYTIRAMQVPPAPIRGPAAPDTVVQVGGLRVSTGFGAGTAEIPQAPTLSANVAVTLGDADTTGVAVPLRSGFRLAGHVEFDGTSAQPPASALRALNISVEPIDGHFPDAAPYLLGQFAPYSLGQVDANSQITTYEIPAGRYIVHVTGNAAGWTLESATTNGVDVSVVPLDLQHDVTDLVVTFTDRATTIAGTVHDDRNTPDGTALVLAFPADETFWTDHGSSSRLMRAARVDTSGHFSFPSPPAGEYFVIAIPDVLGDNWQDPRALQQLATRATRTTIAAGESKTLTLETTKTIK